MALSLSDRDKRMLLIGGPIIALLLILVLVVFPMRSKFARVNKQIATQEKALEESLKTSAELKQLQAQLASSESRFKGSQSFSLFQYMQGLGNSLATPEQLAYIRPQADQKTDDLTISSLDARFQNLDLGQAVGLLSRLEDAPAVIRITSVSLKKRFDRPEFLDMDLKVSAYTQRTP